MTLAERCASFAVAFPNEAAHLRIVREQGHEVAYGRWLLGNNYRRKVGYYGEYPPSFLERVMALFPDFTGPAAVLHAFSGSLPAGNYSRCDVTQPAEFQCRVEDLKAEMERRRHPWPFRLVIADPPYSSADAVNYGTPMVDRARVMRALADIVYVGGFVAWLDTCWPMHRKDQWRTVARIAITRSTNHRVRDLSIFERVSA